MGTKPKRVCIIQRNCPHYRVALYEKLRNFWQIRTLSLRRFYEGGERVSAYLRQIMQTKETKFQVGTAQFGYRFHFNDTTGTEICG